MQYLSRNSATVCSLTVPVPSLVNEEGDTNRLRYGTVSLNINTHNFCRSVPVRWWIHRSWLWPSVRGVSVPGPPDG